MSLNGRARNDGIAAAGGGVKVLDLFAGIGGFSLGLERAGFETVAFCEIDPYCQKVLAKHWPGVPIYDDVRTVSASRLAGDGTFPDVVTGGFPCQDISSAGKGAGITGERSGLWSELARIIGDIRPRYAIVENVTALLSGDSGRWFGRVLGDLAEIGYDAEWHCIPASHTGANHRRDRVWIVAYPNAHGMRLQRVRKAPRGKRPEQQFAGLVQMALQDAIPTRSGSGIHDGASNRSHRLKALGNAVVPQIPELIGRAIMQQEAA
jgi:DNA (cytosine-5)-methyltransferase 1